LDLVQPQTVTLEQLYPHHLQQVAKLVAGHPTFIAGGLVHQTEGLVVAHGPLVRAGADTLVRRGGTAGKQGGGGFYQTGEVQFLLTPGP
jgi:hypothetical protein